MVIKFVDIILDDVNTDDHPDYCDAFVCSATAVLNDGTTRDATDEELEELSNDQELISDLLIDYLY